jgi:uncharacterized membrane protein YdjX (TVP38/TMEM64 family)
MTENHSAKPGPKANIRWLRLFLVLLATLIVSLVLAYFFNRFVSHTDLPIHRIAWVAYLLVFLVSIVTNMSVLVPVPFAVSFMIAAAGTWNPLWVAFFGALGGSIGELSGYYAGYLGKKLAMPVDSLAYRKAEAWIARYGFWAVFFIALQPILPFDVGGFVAGVARMPLNRFLPALFLGKLPKYILFIYAGLGLIEVVPFLRQWLGG